MKHTSELLRWFPLFSFACAGSLTAASLTVATNVNITRSATNNVEETIAINPKNPLNLFATDTWALAARYSTDGGINWSNSNTSALGPSEGDVATAWDEFGNLFLVQFGPSATLPVMLGVSTNGGASFRLVYQTSSTQTDQPSVAVGPSATLGQGMVWITFTDASNNLVAQGAAVTGLGAVGAMSAVQTAPGGGGDFGDIVIGPSGQVMVVYQNANSGEGPDTLRINLDADGLGAGGFGAQTSALTTQVGAYTTIPAQSQRQIDAEAGFAWDHSNGAHRGRLYMAYTDRPSTSSYDTDIYVVHSDNSGTNWSTPVRVNDDTVGNGKSQFLPRIAIDQTTGYIAVSFYDCRNSSTNKLAELWATASVDGGATFLPNVKVSGGASSALPAVVAGFDFGDYTGLAFSGGVFYPCWADNSNSTSDNPAGKFGNFDLYTARVTLNLPVFMVNPRLTSSNFVASVQTAVGKNYYLESTPGLTPPAWTNAASAAGTGLLLDLVDTNSVLSQKFYRVREQ